jgi:5-dehydro-4-deoxyglucarate dehydratase
VSRQAFTLERPGPLAFPITPFDEGGGLDLPAYRAHLEWMMSHEPPALFVACGTGEFAALDPDEIGRLIAATREVVGSDLPVYAGAGQSLAIAQRCARAAADAGATGLLAFPPYLVDAEQSGLLAYYRAIAETTPLGVIVYGRREAPLTLDTVAALSQVNTVVGYKDGVGDIERIQSITRSLGDRLAYFNGMPTAETFQPSYAAAGVAHYSSAVFNFVPEVSWAFHRALEGGDEAAVARLLSEFFVPLAALRNRVRGYAIALVKTGASLRRGVRDDVRPPLIPVAPADRQVLERLIARGLELADAS